MKCSQSCFAGLLFLLTANNSAFAAVVGVHPGTNSPVPLVVESKTNGAIIFVKSSTKVTSAGVGTSADPLPTIAAALQCANPGDVIRVASGLYARDVAALSLPAGVLVESGWTTDFSARTTNANVQLERRADSLGYESGAKQPFTGVNAELTMLPGRANQNIGFSILTPYRNGRIEGGKLFFYPKGALEQERVYEQGQPRIMTAYFSSGTKKYQAELNVSEIIQGAHTRWYPDGTVHARTQHDEQGRFNGEAFEYSEDGQLKAHYLWEHGKIVKIIFETPAQTKHRHETYGRVPWEAKD